MDTRQELILCQTAVANLDERHLQTLIKYLTYYRNRPKKDEDLTMRQFYARSEKGIKWVDWINKNHVSSPRLLLEAANKALEGFSQSDQPAATQNADPQPQYTQPPVIIVQTPPAPDSRSNQGIMPALMSLLIIVILFGLFITNLDTIASALPFFKPLAATVESYKIIAQKGLPAKPSEPSQPPSAPVLPTQTPGLGQPPNPPPQGIATPVPTPGACNDTACLTSKELIARGQNPQAIGPDGQTLQQTWENALKALWNPNDQATSLARWRNLLDASYGPALPTPTPLAIAVPTVSFPPASQPTYPPINEVKGTPTPRAPTPDANPTAKTDPSDVTQTPDCGILELGCTALGEAFGWNKYPAKVPPAAPEVPKNLSQASTPTPTQPLPTLVQPTDTVIVPQSTYTPIPQVPATAPTPYVQPTVAPPPTAKPYVPPTPKPVPTTTRVPSTPIPTTTRLPPTPIPPPTQTVLTPTNIQRLSWTSMMIWITWSNGETAGQSLTNGAVNVPWFRWDTGKKYWTVNTNAPFAQGVEQEGTPPAYCTNILSCTWPTPEPLPTTVMMPPQVLVPAQPLTAAWPTPVSVEQLNWNMMMAKIRWSNGELEGKNLANGSNTVPFFTWNTTKGYWEPNSNAPFAQGVIATGTKPLSCTNASVCLWP